MKYVFRNEKVQMTTAVKDYVTSKLDKLDKYFENPDSVEARIVFVIKGREHKVEVTIPYRNFQLRSESSHSDMYAAIDLVIDKIERQFRKYKTKLVSKQRREEVVNEIEDFFEEESDEIVKRKEVFLKPTDEEEAIVQMELLGHDFYVFKNIDENDKICVLYKRKDGNYGIITAE